MTAVTAVTSPEPEDDPVDEAAEILQTPVGSIEIAGVQCRINRMKTREVFSLLRILTLGGRSVEMIATAFEADKTEAQMAQQLAANLIVTLPNAEEDFVDLIRKMVGKPDGTDAVEWVTVQRELANPDLDTSMAIIQAIVEQEAGELVRLGKAARSWWAVTGPALKAKVETQRKNSG